MLLAIVPPVVAPLIALVVCLLARGPAAQFVVGGGIAVIIAAAVYALLSIQASFFGPSFHDAEQALTTARDRQAALRGEIVFARSHFARMGLTARPLAVFEKYGVNTPCFSPDSRTLALVKSLNGRQIGDPSDPYDCIVELWDLGTGKCRTVLDARDGFTRAGRLCFSPDGRMLAVARRDDSVELWDVQLGHCVLTVRQPHGRHRHVPKGLAFAPNGTIMASAFVHSNDPNDPDDLNDDRDRFYCTLDLWDLTNGRCIASFPPFDERCGIDLCLAFDPAGRFLVVASYLSSGTCVLVLESNTGKCIGKYTGLYGEPVYNMRFDERGRLAAPAVALTPAGPGLYRMRCFLEFSDLSRFGQFVPAETHPLTTPLATRSLPLFSSDLTLMAFPVSETCSEVCNTSTGGSIARVAGLPNAFSPNNQMLVTYLDQTFFGKEARWGLGLWPLPPQGEVV
jgi:WD40 repeat protein